jgi:hypothetical protein
MLHFFLTMRQWKWFVSESFGFSSPIIVSPALYVIKPLPKGQTVETWKSLNKEILSTYRKAFMGKVFTFI